MRRTIFISLSCVAFVFGVASLWLPAQEKSGQEICIRGRLVDENGIPLEGVRVQVSGPGSKGREYQTNSDKEGRFEFRLPADFSKITYELENLDAALLETLRRLLPGLVSVYFSPYFPDKNAGAASVFRLVYGAGYSASGSVSAVLAPGEDHDFGDIVFRKRGIIIEGRVVNKDGKAVSGATIILYVDMGLHVGIATSDDQGSFCIKAYEWCESERTSTLKVFLPDKRTLVPFEFSDWKAWTTQKVELRIAEAPVSLRGKVEKQGSPVADAHVFLYTDGQQSLTTFYPIARTAPDGRFSFSDIPPGRYSVHVISEHNGRTSAMVEVPGEDVLIQYPETEPGSLHGKIRLVLEGIPNIPSSRRDIEKGPMGLFLCDSKGHLVKPMVPAALLDVSQDNRLMSFTAKGLKPGKVVFQIRQLTRSGEPKNLLDEKNRNFFASGLYSMFEEWRPFPQDRFLKRVTERLNAEITEIKTGKLTELDIEIVVTYDEFEQLVKEAFTRRGK